MSAKLQAPAFTDDNAAREAMEAVLWPHGPVCPRCGSLDRIGKVSGKSARPGLHYCGECKRQFTVTVGTIFERSKVPLSKWWLAVHLLASSKKGISSHQLMRLLGVTYQTAWFMTHRIREAMRDGSLSPLGGSGKTVEIDETIFGKQDGAPKNTRFRGAHFRNVVLTLVERGGSARSWHVDGTTIGTLIPIIRANVAQESAVMTDEAMWYKNLNKEGSFASHDAVNHSKDEYARHEGDFTITTNTVEGYYSIFKRGMKGVYQHCGEKHLHRYLAEFDFRYSNRSALGVEDSERAAKIIKGAKGRRLTYRRPESAAHA
jgi:transposase-like protein